MGAVRREGVGERPLQEVEGGASHGSLVLRDEIAAVGHFARWLSRRR